MTRRWSTTAAIAMALAALALGACRQDMHDQPKYEALESSKFFPNGSSARIPPANTVARDQLHEDSVYYTGYDADNQLVDKIPFKVTHRTLERGQETFNTFCSPCHDRAGTGRGMIVRRGYPQPPTYHQERLRKVKDGYIFDVITNGFARMPSYASQIPVADRWAVVAYVRTLQLAQHAPMAGLTPEQQKKVEEGGLLSPSVTEVKDVRGTPDAPDMAVGPNEGDVETEGAAEMPGSAGAETTTDGTH